MMKHDKNSQTSATYAASAEPASGPVQARDAEVVMKLARLGSFHQSRLSFMRIFTRRMQRDGWSFRRADFEVNAAGVGHAVYTLSCAQRSYSLVAFSHDIPDELRSDRVIATAWDATFTLYDGIPDAQDIARLAANVPLQEAGRVSHRELTLSRANRSVRLWQYVVNCLASGVQPERSRLQAVGYLMRTTAVYGSGKFGALDREHIQDRPELSEPFQAEMMTVYLIRQFVRDLVEHMASTKNADTAVPLDDSLACSLGIGNSTGLGMAPFLINHPCLFNNWIAAREEALRRVLSLPDASASEADLFMQLVQRAQVSVSHWHSEHPVQKLKIQSLTQDIQTLIQHLHIHGLSAHQPWKNLFDWASDTLQTEAQECLVSLLLEPYPALVDELADSLSYHDAGGLSIDGSMRLGELRGMLQTHYGWALNTDWQQQDNIARAWYVSEEKLEPRLGERFEEDIADYEQPLAPGRDAAALYDCIGAYDDQSTVAECLLLHPEHRQAVKRVQLLSHARYAEIQDNTISATLVPFDLLRCKLSFFGATHFDPRSDRWLRICLYANAPYPEDIGHSDADRWVYPQLES